MNRVRRPYWLIDGKKSSRRDQSRLFASVDCLLLLLHLPIPTIFFALFPHPISRLYSEPVTSINTTREFLGSPPQTPQRRHHGHSSIWTHQSQAFLATTDWQAGPSQAQVRRDGVQGLLGIDGQLHELAGTCHRSHWRRREWELLHQERA